MKLQTDAQSCGPFAILNALRALGRKVSIKKVRAHTDTTDAGTNEHGVQNAILKLGFEAAEFRHGKDLAHETLLDYLGDGWPVLLSVENARHWVTAVGRLGDRVVTFDPWKAAWNRQENGIDVLTKKDLMRWWSPDEVGGYYGIAVRRTK